MKGMSLAFLLLFGLAWSRVPKVQQEPFPGFLNFTQGLIKGLELNENSPGACEADLATAENSLISIVSDVQGIIGGDVAVIPQLIIDSGNFVNELLGSNTDCEWTTLLAEIESLGTPAGRQQIFTNVVNNIGPIFSDAEDLANCPQNWFLCGFNVAQIFQYVFNWGVSVPRARVEFPYVQVSGFLEGFLNGIETQGSDGSCISDIQGVAPLLDTVVSEIEQAFTGDISAALEAFSNLKVLLSDAEGFNSDCNFTGLVSVIESLTSPVGWVQIAQNFAENLSTITTDFDAFKTCAADSTQCGFSAGQILQLVLGWGLGPQQ